MPPARGRPRVHRNPHSTYRDDAYAPLHEAGWRVKETDLRKMRSGIFSMRNLDDPNRVEMAREIRSLAQCFQGLELADRAVAHPKRLLICRSGDWQEQGRCLQSETEQQHFRDCLVIGHDADVLRSK